MKKKAFVLSIPIALILSLCWLGMAEAQLRFGQRGEEILNLQEALKEDPEIYPEGYVTGYFGPLTQRAIKRLQRRCGLPVTGIVDEETLRCIFPKVKITVISPNGGENWDRNKIQTIKWKVEVVPEEEFLPKRYIWRKASIDLFKRINAKKSVFVKHIATVDLFATAYSWRITPDIPNGSDYVIRISSGKRIIPLIRAERMKKILPPAFKIWPFEPITLLPPWRLAFDESDEPFTITGEIKPIPDLSEVIKILEEVSRNLEKMAANLKRAIDLLKGITLPQT